MATLTKSTGTVTLAGAVEKVTFPAVYGWVWVKNMSDSDMFAGLSESVSAGADGVLAIPAGDAGRIQTDGQDSVYLIGSGNALVVAQNYADSPFKVGGKGGESPDLSAYAKKTDIRNENLLINPDFKINQRGVSGTKIPDKNAEGDDIHTYFVDRWGIDSGSVTINADGTLTLNGTMSQIFENAVGNNVTASVSAGTATYDDSTKTFSITANGEIISWAKLEYGSNATQFFPPDTATELLKCERFFRTFDSHFALNTIGSFHHNGNNQFVYIFDTPMRVAPDLIFTDCVVRRVSEPYVDVSVTLFNSLSTKRALYIYCEMDTLYDDAIFMAKSDNGLAADAEIY